MAAQARRSFRESTLSRSLIVPTVLGICAFIAGRTQVGPWTFDFAEELLLILIGFFLLLQAPSRMSSLMAAERNSGILEFHQATPTTGWTDALGYLVGGTVRHYSRALVLVFFFLVASVANQFNLLDALGAMLILCSTGLLYQLLAMLLGLIGGKRGFFVTLSTAIPILLLLFGRALVKMDITILAHLTPYPALIDLAMINPEQASGQSAYSSYLFGISVSPFLYTCVYQLFISFFLFLAVARKLRRTEATVFSKPGALFFYLILSILLMSDLYAPQLAMGRIAIFVYIQTTIILGILMTTFICPNFLQFLRRERRIVKNNLSRYSPFDDNARVWFTTSAFGVIWAFLFYLANERFTALGIQQAVTSGESLLLILQVFGLFAFTAAVCEYAHFASGKSVLASLGLVILVFVIVPWFFFAFGQINQSIKPLSYLGVISPTYGTIFASMYYVWPFEKPPITNGTEHISHALTLILTALFLGRTRKRLDATTRSTRFPQDGRPAR